MSIAQAVNEVRQGLPRLQRQDDGRAPIGIVERLIMESTWWLTHPSGGPVHAPKHWERIQERGSRYEIEFGANSFLVETAILRCARRIREAADEVERTGKLISRGMLQRQLVNCLRQSVANYCGEEFDDYPIRGGYLEFGTTGICVGTFLGGIWQRTKLDLITEIVPEDEV